METQTYSDRRLNLADLLPGIPVLLHSGSYRVRNYASYPYPFRASSHYLYFGGPALPDQILLILNGEATLYREPPSADDAVWHGAPPSEENLVGDYEFQAVKSFEELNEDLATLGLDEVLAVPSPDAGSNAFLEKFLGRVPALDEDPDIDLVDALIEMRLRHDAGAQEQLREASKATVEMQKMVAKACSAGKTELELKALLDQHLTSQGMAYSFQPILSVAGEVLHNPYYANTLSEGDLLLVDCGAELSSGWAGDLTRVYPVSGTFSETQKALYNVVDKARAEAISQVAPGVQFKDLHMAASRIIAEGLVELGILKGDVDEIVEKGAHALFFPHGLGHLVGLDVHDMEDLGDLVGYPDGDERDPQFGLSNLRLNRELEAGMVVTIEPGFYQISALIDGELGEQFADYLDREALARYSDVRGIRLEDVVLVTEDGHEVLSSDLPVAADEVEALLRA